MKKLLSILGALTITAINIPNVIAVSTYNKQELINNNNSNLQNNNV